MLVKVVKSQGTYLPEEFHFPRPLAGGPPISIVDHAGEQVLPKIHLQSKDPASSVTILGQDQQSLSSVGTDWEENVSP